MDGSELRWRGDNVCGPMKGTQMAWGKVCGQMEAMGGVLGSRHHRRERIRGRGVGFQAGTAWGASSWYGVAGRRVWLEDRGIFAVQVRVGRFKKSLTPAEL